MHKAEVFEYKLFMTSRARGLARRFPTDFAGSFLSNAKYETKYKRLRLMIFRLYKYVTSFWIQVVSHNLKNNLQLLSVNHD